MVRIHRVLFVLFCFVLFFFFPRTYDKCSYSLRLLWGLVREGNACRSSKVSTDEAKENIDRFRKKWTLFNIHTSDKIEMFFSSSILSREGHHFVYHGESGESLMHRSAALTQKKDDMSAASTGTE